MVPLAYPIDRLDWAMFSVVILFHHWFPQLERIENRAFILPRNIPVVLIIFAGQGGTGNPPSHKAGRASIPSSPKVVLKNSRTQVVIKWYGPEVITNCLPWGFKFFTKVY